MHAIHRSVFLVSLIFLVTGCTVFTPPAQMEQIKEPGTYWLNYSSDRRGAIVSNTNGQNNIGSIKVCAEPAPDTSSNFEGQGNVKKDAIGEASAQIGQSTIILPGRNSNVLSLREALYRLCELSINRPDIPPSDLMAAYNKVINAVTQGTEAETAKVEAATTVFVRAKNEERKGFENIVKGDFSAALSNFSNAEELYPGYHNVFEISKALKSALADNKLEESEKQTLFRNISGKWAWGVPHDVMQQITEQISGSALRPATP